MCDCIAQVVFVFAQFSASNMDRPKGARGGYFSAPTSQDAPPAEARRPLENPFETLGITFEDPATQALIENGGPEERKNFVVRIVRQLARDHHPDRSTDSADHQRRLATMQSLNEARDYLILSDEAWNEARRNLLLLRRNARAAAKAAAQARTQTARAQAEARRKLEEELAAAQQRLQAKLRAKECARQWREVNERAAREERERREREEREAREEQERQERERKDREEREAHEARVRAEQEERDRAAELAFEQAAAESDLAAAQQKVNELG